MGKTASPLVSFRITMGMLVTGSIISPRIFISTSIVAPGAISDFRLKSSLLRSLYHHFAQQAVGKAPGGNHGNITARCRNHRRRPGEIQRLVLRSATDPLTPGLVLSFNHHFKDMPHMPLIPPSLDLALSLLQDHQPAGFLFV